MFYWTKQYRSVLLICFYSMPVSMNIVCRFCTIDMLPLPGDTFTPKPATCKPTYTMFIFTIIVNGVNQCSVASSLCTDEKLAATDTSYAIFRFTVQLYSEVTEPNFRALPAIRLGFSWFPSVSTGTLGILCTRPQLYHSKPLPIQHS